MLNSVTLLGNLGKDPEVRQTQSGITVASFSLATTRKWTDKDGQKQEETEWHRIVAWARLGETCGQYLYKGSKALVSGRLQTRSWQDKDGATRYTTEIVANDVQFLTPRSSNNETPTTNDQVPSTGQDAPF